MRTPLTLLSTLLLVIGGGCFGWCAALDDSVGVIWRQEGLYEAFPPSNSPANVNEGFEIVWSGEDVSEPSKRAIRRFHSPDLELSLRVYKHEPGVYKSEPGNRISFNVDSKDPLSDQEFYRLLNESFAELNLPPHEIPSDARLLRGKNCG